MPTNDHPTSESVHSVKLSIKHRKTGEFLVRNSLLTDLFQISHINCVRNAFTATFILMVARTLLDDWTQYGRLNWTFELLRTTVGQLHRVAGIWTLMTLSTSCLVFGGVYTWANHRKSVATYRKLYDCLFLILYLIYLTLLLVIPSWQIIKHQFPVVSSAIILAEQLRQLMKTHSFVRENVERCTKQSDGSSSLQSNSPREQSTVMQSSHFQSYVYFLFAPTLLYRDTYPRTPTIRWTYVGKMFGQFGIGLILVYHVINVFWLPVFRRILTDEPTTLASTIADLYDLMIPGVLIVILAFYGFFHCWLNGFAEILRFADRMFYEDWWNLTSAATFWRSWNVVVHDWLVVYVYKDLDKVFHLPRKVRTVAVVIVSAIFHEYFVTVALGLFSPVLVAWFGIFGVLFRFSFPRSKGMNWNIFLLTFVPICTALIPYLYVLEVAARDFPAKRTTLRMEIFENNERPKLEM